MFELNINVKDILDNIKNILLELEKLPEINIFLEPITDEIVPNYKDYIKNPMDIQTLKSKLDTNKYNTLLEVLLDIQTIWNNCRSFNKSSTSYYRNADKLDKKLLSLLKNDFGIAFIEKYENYLIENNIYFKDANNRVSDKFIQWYSNNKSLEKHEDNHEKRLNKQKLSIIQGIKRLKSKNLNLFLNDVHSLFPKNYFKIINNELVLKLDSDKKKLDLVEKTIHNIIND